MIRHEIQRIEQMPAQKRRIPLRTAEQAPAAGQPLSPQRLTHLIKINEVDGPPDLYRQRFDEGRLQFDVEQAFSGHRQIEVAFESGSPLGSRPEQNSHPNFRMHSQHRLDVGIRERLMGSLAS